LISSQAWSWLDNRLIRLIFGFNRCIELLFLVLTLELLLFRSWAKKVVKKACSKTKMKKKDQMVLLMKEHRLRHKPELKLNKLLCKNKLKQRDKKKKEKRRKKREEHNKKKKKRE
jgi:hypothetical protein